jgi:hypothetical protein
MPPHSKWHCTVPCSDPSTREAKAIPSRKLVIDWHAPDGWVVAHQELDAGQTRIALAAPVAELEQPGRYRVVLRSRLDSLAEDTLSVAK